MSKIEVRVMRKLLTPMLLFMIVGTIACLSSGIVAQVPRDVSDGRRLQPDEPPAGRRPNLLQELGLSPDQIRAVRQINQERKPVEQAARQRFQDAQRALNSAIYADEVSEADVQARLRDFQAAQADLAKIKFTNELAVRKLLTPEQLIKFRELRQRFADLRENFQKTPPANRPLRRLRRGALAPVN